MVSEQILKRINKMIEIADKIIDRTKEKTFDALKNEENFQEAMCFLIGQIAECIPGYKKISDKKEIKEDDYDEFFAIKTDIKWSEIKGMRNRIYHNYEGIELNIVWEALQDMPYFKKQLEDLKNKLS